MNLEKGILVSTLEKKVRERIEIVHSVIDDYLVTTQSILALINILTFDQETKGMLPSSSFGIGREMTTSAKNKVANGHSVTPDIVVQRIEIEGYVVEVKCGLPRNRDYWKKYVNQFVKYDDPELKGWWTENELIQNMNLIGLFHQSRAIDFHDFLMQELSERGIDLDTQFAIIQYSRDIRKHTFITLQKIEGEIINEQLNRSLRSSVGVPIERVVSNPKYKDLKFYDARPSVEYVMWILWLHIFPEKNALSGQLNETLNTSEFFVSAAELTIDLQKAYGHFSPDSRETCFPKTEWVQSALDKFVEIDLAAKHTNDDYSVYFKKISGDVLEEIIFRLVKLENGIDDEIESEQMSLFIDEKEE